MVVNGVNGGNAVKPVDQEPEPDIVQIQYQELEDVIVRETKVRIVTHKHALVR